MTLEVRGKKPLSEATVFEMLSDEYGWLPSEIRAERYDDIIKYVDIIDEKTRLKNKKQ